MVMKNKNRKQTKRLIEEASKLREIVLSIRNGLSQAKALLYLKNLNRSKLSKKVLQNHCKSQ